MKSNVAFKVNKKEASEGGRLCMRRAASEDIVLSPERRVASWRPPDARTYAHV